MSLCPKKLKNVLDELKASWASRQRAWENLQEIRTRALKIKDGRNSAPNRIAQMWNRQSLCGFCSFAFFRIGALAKNDHDHFRRLVSRTGARHCPPNVAGRVGVNSRRSVAQTAPATTTALTTATAATNNASAPAVAPGGGNGQVWVNTKTHVYHTPGSRWYGKTKEGKYMTEQQAIQEGDRAAAKND